MQNQKADLGDLKLPNFRKGCTCDYCQALQRFNDLIWNMSNFDFVNWIKEHAFSSNTELEFMNKLFEPVGVQMVENSDGTRGLVDLKGKELKQHKIPKSITLTE